MEEMTEGQIIQETDIRGTRKMIVEEIEHVDSGKVVVLREVKNV